MPGFRSSVRLWWVALLAIRAAGQVVPGRYIIELEGPPASTMRQFSRRGQNLTLREKVRAAQFFVRQQVEAEAEVVDSIDTVANALIVRGSDAVVDRIRSSPGVKRIHPVRRHSMLLDRALPLHGIPEALAFPGGGLAGAGVKIAIVDSGIDVSHPGMQDAALTAPEGYPRTISPLDVEFTNSKVIVARSYAGFFETVEDDLSARDQVGHGTAAAMAAAGVPNTGPFGSISGVAPKAFLGSYKIFGSPGANDFTTSDLVIKAVDDALADGMDVINLSLGGAVAPRIEDDFEVAALEQAIATGVIIVIAAGNTGPDLNTIASPATTPSAITVGASRNDRMFGGEVAVEGGSSYFSLPGSGPNSADPIAGTLADVSAVDASGLACGEFPADSLRGRVALILRGICTFEDKINHAQRAGAVAVLIYNDEARGDDIVQMSVGSARLPAAMIRHADGLDLKQRSSESPINVSVRFTVAPFAVDPKRVTRFSARGPSVDISIKPDLVAVGSDLYTATQRANSSSELFDSSGYTVTGGTSFSAPIVSGAAALLKAARPGLSAAQYKSLLVNYALPFSGMLQEEGAGSLRLDGAVQSTLAVAPVSISFGAGGADPRFSRTLMVTNVGAAAGDYTLSASSTGEAPVLTLSASSLTLASGESVDVGIEFAASTLAEGQYRGVIYIRSQNGGLETRVPYWYAVASRTPGSVAVLHTEESGPPGRTVPDAIIYRITDSSGVIIPDAEANISALSGGGSVVRSVPLDREIPGAVSVTVRLGPGGGANVFRIEAGGVTRDITITGR